MVQILLEDVTLGTWVDICPQSQIVNKHSKVTVAAILYHCDGGMRV
jgi:hypothetical protein